VLPILLFVRAYRDAEGSTRARFGECLTESSDFALTIDHLDRPADEGFLETFARELEPKLACSGVTKTATMITEPSTNTFFRDCTERRGGSRLPFAPWQQGGFLPKSNIKCWPLRARLNWRSDFFEAGA
jgi:hypothetical protein